MFCPDYQLSQPRSGSLNSWPCLGGPRFPTPADCLGFILGQSISSLSPDLTVWVSDTV